MIKKRLSKPTSRFREASSKDQCHENSAKQKCEKIQAVEYIITIYSEEHSEARLAIIKSKDSESSHSLELGTRKCERFISPRAKSEGLG